eukprot:52448-Chlamydomonas_euryale.AAC.5
MPTLTVTPPGCAACCQPCLQSACGIRVARSDCWLFRQPLRLILRRVGGGGGAMTGEHAIAPLVCSNACWLCAATHPCAAAVDAQARGQGWQRKVRQRRRYSGHGRARCVRQHPGDPLLRGAGDVYRLQVS